MKIIYTNHENSFCVVHPSPSWQGTLEELAAKDVPADLPYEIVEDTDIPTDRTFRNAWEHDTTSAPEKVAVNLPKAKEIAHEVRRAARSEEFAPLDIKATIPAEATQAEADRQVVRDKYAAMQTAIDGASTPDEIKTAMGATA